MDSYDKITKLLSSQYSDALDQPEDILNSIIKSLTTTTILNRYQYIKKIGEGSFKEVSIENDKLTGRDIALSTLKENLAISENLRFINEAYITAKLGHNNIITLHDFGYRQNRLFFTTEYLRGCSLNQHLKKFRDLTERLKLFLALCSAVEHSHSQRIIHLDIKPSNIHVSKYGELTLLDWGLARDLNEPGLQGYYNNLFAGSPGYTAPEQIDCEDALLDELTDIYSMGAVLFYLLTHSIPWNAADSKEAFKMAKNGDKKILKEELVKSHAPTSLIAVCLKCMSAKREERYIDVKILKKDVEAFLNGYITEAEKASFYKLSYLLIKRHKAQFFLSFCFSLIISAAIVSYRYNLQKEKEKAQSFSDAQAEIYYQKARTLYENFQPHEALSTLREAEYLGKDDQESTLLKVKIFSVLGEYSLAVNASSKLDIAKNEPRKIKEVLGNEPSKDNLYIFDLYLESFNKKNLPGVVLKMIRYRYSQLKTQDERINEAKRLLRVLNPHHLAVFWFHKKNGRLHFKGAGYLTDIAPLVDLPLEAIDISETSAYNIECLSNMKTLKHLNLSKTYVYNLKPLQGLELEYLNISHTCTYSIRHLRDTKIDKLIFKGVKLKYLKELLRKEDIKILDFDQDLYNSHMDKKTILKLRENSRLSYE